MAQEPQFRYIVRIAGTDIDGKLKLPYGLSEIKGIGYSTAMAIIRMLGLDPEKRIGFLTDSEIKRVEEAIKNFDKLGFPPWIYNRRKDYETGEDRHLIGADLLFHARRDIDREIKINSWRGVRHKAGLKVRGQRTHTTGRLGMTIGVAKKRR
ncbi:MAG: 30S ribosomal protein S13 [Desulfurococcales archaeon]|nr:30S ribosomal protein S13 [Desulfurococcales archaeon]